MGNFGELSDFSTFPSEKYNLVTSSDRSRESPSWPRFELEQEDPEE